ncbi:MAG: hypothetical protein JNK48_32545 [Bryobacterales bacterium]|nr:hypothetical protein [Bryobacterales bacterium]
MLRQVAGGFQLTGLILGIPSLLAALFFGGYALFLKFTAPPDTPAAHAGPSLVNYLVDAARLAGKAFGFLGAVAQAVFTFFACIALLVLLFAVLCFFTGRGLHANAPWARITAMLISGVTLFIAAIGILSTRRVPGLLLFGPFATAAGYTLWTLLRR